MSRKVPPLYRFVAERSGQSNPLAVIILLGITITSSGLIIGVGTQAFDGTRETASLSLNEQSMSKLDAEAAVVALGSADTRQIRLGDDGDGRYSVRDSGSWIRIEHRNYTGTGSDETIYNESLGGVVYESGGDTIAYEGGGVWRTAETGNTTMISPPEFRYRGATLTLPVIRVTGDTDVAGGGRPTAGIQSAATDERVFPTNGSANPGTGAPYDDGSPYANPVTNGSVAITVHSPHYAGWADYFRERTEGNVTVDDANEEATVVLEGSQGEVGEFVPPAVGDSLDVPSVGGGHAVEEFTLELDAHNSGSGFNNRIWGMEYDGTDERFAVQVNSAQGNEKCQGGTYDGDVQLIVYYDNKTTGKYQTFEGFYDGDDDADDPIAVDCDGGDGGNPQMNINLTHTSQMTYKEPSSPGGYDEQPFQSADSSASIRDGIEATEHRPGPDDGVTLNAGSTTKSVDWVVNHYVGKVSPQFTLTVVEGPGSANGNNNNNSGVDEDASAGELRYGLAAGSDFIRYLHVTENEIRVRIT